MAYIQSFKEQTWLLPPSIEDLIPEDHAVLGPMVLPALAGLAKPLLKEASKDVVAEAKAEMEDVHAEAAPAAVAGGAAVRVTKPRSQRKSAKPKAKGKAGA